MRLLGRIRRDFSVCHRHFVTGSKASDRVDAIAPLEFRKLLHDIDACLDSKCREVAGEYPLAVALSGGADSLTLTFLLDEYLRKWEQEKTVSLLAITVDHQLRIESREEAEYVCRICKERAIAHVIASSDWSAVDPRQLVDGKPKKSRMQVQARNYRYASLKQMCQKFGVKYLFVGHTLDDQEETILLRLARGSGLNGLAGMEALTKWFWNEEIGDHTYLVRPLLSVSKSRLQQTCTQRFHQDWVEDPSNHSDVFDRVRIRKAMAKIRSEKGEGAFDCLLPLHQIASEAKKEFKELEKDVLEKHTMKWSSSQVLLDAAFRNEYQELSYRVLIRILNFVGQREHPPRLSSVSKLLRELDQLTCGRKVTIHGCSVKKVEKGRILSFEPEHPHFNGS